MEVSAASDNELPKHSEQRRGPGEDHRLQQLSGYTEILKGRRYPGT